MIVFRDPDTVPRDFGPSIVVVGKFDGVHAGHRAMIDHARALGDHRRAQIAAVTFDRNPLRTLRPESWRGDLVTPEQKARLLADAGVDATLMLRFDHDLAALSPGEFVERFLVEGVHASHVVVGHDFRFGKGGAGDAKLLRRAGRTFGFGVDVIENVRVVGVDRRVSSTWIRSLVRQGDVDLAGRLLGRPPSVSGEVSRARRSGTESRFSVAQLSTSMDGIPPAEGVYAGWLVGGCATWPRGDDHRAVITVSNPKSVAASGDGPVIRARVRGQAAVDLLGQRVDVRFTERLTDVRSSVPSPSGRST
ncbi:adenylyltransferase/cytidyltransferase family protein [Microbacterium sp. LWH7-1.2]|uniref:adenylyltransferase/cytidyltransferase family protein n=1 Tax=Microbacterium sp. LWH7-1.2 TaxID=3135257 RepID=UPI00313949AA